MVCVDESEDSLAALEWTLKEVVRAGDAVRIVHAVKMVNAALFSNVLREMEDQQRKLGNEIVQNAIRRCEQEKVLLLPRHHEGILAHTTSNWSRRD